MIFNNCFPLRIILLNWWLNRRSAKRVSVTVIDYGRRFRELDAFQAHLPLPHGRLETLVTKLLNQWLDRERADLVLMESMRILATGTLSFKR